MHDCKIPETIELREAEIKNFENKINSTQRAFTDAEKLNIELDPSHSRH